MAFQRTSSIPQVKAALVATFTTALATSSTDPAGGQVPVFYGDPNEPTREHVIVGDTFNPEQQTWSAIGHTSREEVYALTVWVETTAWPDQQTATERAFTLFALLETALRADPTIGIAQGAGPNGFKSLILEVAQAELHEAADPDNKGFFARVVWAVKAKVRI